MIQTTVDGILESVRSIGLSMEEQAELIQRLRDGEGEEHKPDGRWVSDINGFWEPPKVVGLVESDNPDVGLEVTFYHGQKDGKPVIQIDGEADFRINVNDCPIWDQQTGEPYVMPEELEADMVVNVEPRVAKCSHCGKPHHSSWCLDDFDDLKEEE